MHIDEILSHRALDEVGPDRFTGGGFHFPGATWTFGGLLVGQTMLAATATGEGRSVRSHHLSFVSRTDPHRPIEYTVERVDDRTTFAHRTVIGRQDGDVRLLANVLLHREEDGPDHQSVAAVATGPDDVADTYRRFFMEVRDASEPPVFSPDSTEGSAPSDIAVWYRIPELDGPPQLHDAVLGLASDVHLLETAWRPVEGASIAHMGRVVSNTLTQTTWFHQPVRFDRWLQFRAHSPRAHGGRSLCVGHWFDEDGSLVASCTQEGLMRIREARS